MSYRRIPSVLSTLTLSSLLLTSSCKGPEGADGAAGPAGPQGAAGAAGAQGPIGPAGLSGVQAVTYPAPIDVGPGSIVTGTVVCPTGKVAIGGGFKSTTTLYATASYPDAANPQWWHVSIHNPTSATAPVTLYAVCAITN